MFSTGQQYFAIFFVIAFIITMIYVYRKDLKEMKQQYKGTYWILFGFLLFIGLLFFIKFYLKD
ncbi:hypothetical protein [Flavobacterium sp. J27]|uniref:hypothetical protein n=1 Tax=Flavobacterium sp. J27 TaxID=2060419 RepID=UPI0010309DCC|nr:hypothetical protein [Flavobacterium sp. J27]